MSISSFIELMSMFKVVLILSASSSARAPSFPIELYIKFKVVKVVLDLSASDIVLIASAWIFVKLKILSEDSMSMLLKDSKSVEGLILHFTILRLGLKLQLNHHENWIWPALELMKSKWYQQRQQQQQQQQQKSKSKSIPKISLEIFNVQLSRSSNTSDLSFRNYTPNNEELKAPDSKIFTPADINETVEKKMEGVVEKVIQEEEEKRAKDVDIFTLAPKTPNWDLKRDIEPKLLKLEKRTRAAVIEYIRKERPHDLSMA
ncbi:cwf18 pre-mRNA splicing factor-domain-containing protein [Lobosporangium transversale]|uniref:Cwf18 pre-mRNA splicing factor-domain-containing protein n=1 Tax=Lobosporangium transversale TaxID=64571 RepID=A0A1Y2H0A1_9FUNG|nr:cwf18 pre-mRNA splicing factor-domain-containing protein [Lobosporangium transversale]ORZ27956.1 cwf18 pre-mRNA splicing factor-domain-containing protein [Lobosporangium transversale]|eukprot:XP_021885659.1 cwf18 pre-mRNA splicing factor-domain-containing protein [Lobosporangium transversale]